jgi:hypothetical protein
VPSHEFQLVLQLPDNCPLAGLDFEDDIAKALKNPRGDQMYPHMIDGNSYGGGTIEFFAHTADPQVAFELCQPLLASFGLLSMVMVSYRRFSEDSFTIIWPPNILVSSNCERMDGPHGQDYFRAHSKMPANRFCAFTRDVTSH